MAFRNCTLHKFPVVDDVCIKLASNEEGRANSICTEYVENLIREDERSVVEGQGHGAGHRAPVNHSTDGDRRAPRGELMSLIRLMSRRSIHRKRGGKANECRKHKDSSEPKELHKYVDRARNKQVFNAINNRQKSVCVNATLTREVGVVNVREWWER